MAGVVGHASQRGAQTVIAGPAKRHSLALAGFCGEPLGVVEALSHAPQFTQDLGGAYAPGARETHEDAGVFAGLNCVFDAAGRQADLLDQARHHARKGEGELAIGFLPASLVFNRVQCGETGGERRRKILAPWVLTRPILLPPALALTYSHCTFSP